MIPKVWPTTNIVRIDLVLVSSTIANVPDVRRAILWAIEVSIVHDKVSDRRYIVSALRLSLITWFPIDSLLLHPLSVGRIAIRVNGVVVDIVYADDRGDVCGAFDAIIP